jgi:hypothetical protein
MKIGKDLPSPKLMNAQGAHASEMWGCKWHFDSTLITSYIASHGAE